MDRVDATILAALLREPLAPLASVGRSAGLTANAVRRRLENLEEAGVFRGFGALPHPALFGRHGTVVVFAPGSASAFDRGALVRVEDVAGWSTTHLDQLAVLAWTPDPAEPVPPGVREAVPAPVERTFLQRARPLTPPGAALSPNEWRVLEALVRAPRATVPALAAAAGVSAKVARRVRDFLVRGGHVHIEPLVFSDAARGIVLYELYVAGPAATDPEGLAAALGGAWVVDRIAEPVGALLLCRGERLGDAIHAADRARAVPGVVHAELILSQDGGFASEALARRCARAREEMEAKRAAARPA